MIRAFDVAWTDADGRFVFERVLPGDGFLGSGGASRVRADGVYENISLTEVPVTLSAGQTAHVDLNHWLRTVSGKLASPTGSKEKVPWKSAFITIRIDSSRPPPLKISRAPQNKARPGGQSSRPTNSDIS